MSDFFASSASRSTLRFCTSSAYSFAASIFIAVSRFWCWLRPVWQATTVLVGMWVMRTADSVLLTCWPPAPEDRYTSVRRSAGLMSISMLSSTSGETNTAVKLVWRRLSESNGDLRPSRCTPISVFSQPWAYPPSTRGGWRGGPQVGGVGVGFGSGGDLRRDRNRGEAGVAAVVGIERRLAHQPVHADLGLQPAVGVLALDPERGRLDPRHVAAADFHQLGLPAAMLAPAQVHAQQHLGPVLRLGTAGPGLDVDEGVGRIHLAGEHALELQPVDAAGEALDILDHGAGRVLVVLGLGQVQQLAGTGQALGQLADAVDGLVEQRALAPQRLRAVGVVPDVGVFPLAS